MTISDILMIPLFLIVTSLAVWGTLMVINLFFPYKVAKVARITQNSPWKSLITGFFVMGPSLIFIIILASIPAAPVKILALLLFLALMAYAAIGVTGQARALAERLKDTAGDISTYGGTTRATALLVLVFNIPLLGWFLLAPVSMMVGLGSLVLARFAKEQAPLAAQGGVQ